MLLCIDFQRIRFRKFYRKKSPLGLSPFVEKIDERFPKVQSTDPVSKGDGALHLKNDSMDISINSVSPNGVLYIFPMDFLNEVLRGVRKHLNNKTLLS